MKAGDLTSTPSAAIHVKVLWSFTQAIYTYGFTHMTEVTRYSCPLSSNLYTSQHHGTTDQLEILLACYGESPMRPDVPCHLGLSSTRLLLLTLPPSLLAFGSSSRPRLCLRRGGDSRESPIRPAAVGVIELAAVAATLDAEGEPPSESAIVTASGLPGRADGEGGAGAGVAQDVVLQDCISRL